MNFSHELAFFLPSLYIKLLRPSSNEIGLLRLSSSFSVIHVNVDIEIKAK